MAARPIQRPLAGKSRPASTTFVPVSVPKISLPSPPKSTPLPRPLAPITAPLPPPITAPLPPPPTTLPPPPTTLKSPPKLSPPPKLSQPSKPQPTKPSTPSKNVPAAAAAAQPSQSAQRPAQTQRPTQTQRPAQRSAQSKKPYQVPYQRFLLPKEVEEWKKHLREFLYIFLQQTGAPKAHLDIILNDKNMETWMVAFTHQSYDLNQGDNYEELEFLGDRALKSLFTEYCMIMYPNANKDQLSNMQNLYLSKPELASISQQLGFQPYIRSITPINIHTNEDVTESVFGALHKISNSIQFGYAYILGFNLLKKIFEKKELDVYTRPPKTYVIQLYEKLRWKTPRLKQYDTGSNTIGYELKFTEEERNYIIFHHPSGEGWENIPMEIATGEGVDSDSAELDLYTNAVAFFNDWNINWEWADEIILKKAYASNQQFKELADEAARKAIDAGYESINFITYTIGAKTSFTQLYAIDQNGRKIILAAVEGNLNKIEQRQKVLQAYIDQE